MSQAQADIIEGQKRLKDENPDVDAPISSIVQQQESIHLILETQEEEMENSFDKTHPEEFYLVEPRGYGSTIFVIIEDQVL